MESSKKDKKLKNSLEKRTFVSEEEKLERADRLRRINIALEKFPEVLELQRRAGEHRMKMRAQFEKVAPIILRQIGYIKD